MKMWKRFTWCAICIFLVSGFVACSSSSSTNNGGTTTTYTISGAVSSGSAGLQGVTMTLNGVASATVNTDASGNYSFTNLANGNYTITPSKTGYTFNPTNSAQTVNDANLSSINFTATTAAASYSLTDLDGTWYAAGLKTPVKNSSNNVNFGYDVNQVAFSNGTGTSTNIASSDSAPTDTFTISIDGNGVISTGALNDYWFMNAGKDAMYHFWTDSVTGEQQLFVFVKKAVSYSLTDLDGTWYAAGLKTPVKNSSNIANLGYDVNQVVFSNGTGTSTNIASSDSAPTDTFTISIDGNGVISTGALDDYWFMNAGKDAMYHFWTDSVTGEQQLFVFVKKAVSYSLTDLDGTWYAAGLKTPIKNSSNIANLGYDVNQVIFSNGTGTSTNIASSDSAPTDTFTISIDGNGVISTGALNDYWFMNAGKDAMYHFRTDSVTGEQQLFVFVKKQP